jgi:hypothetical protein
VWLVFSYYLAPPSAGPFVFGAPCFGHMQVETAGLFLPLTLAPPSAGPFVWSAPPLYSPSGHGLLNVL